MRWGAVGVATAANGGGGGGGSRGAVVVLVVGIGNRSHRTRNLFWARRSQVFVSARGFGLCGL